MIPAGTSETSLVDAQDARHAWHPFTPMSEYAANPRVHIARGEGFRLVDTEGRSYLDGSSSLWTNVHGHNHPELNAAIVEQLGKVAHATLLGLNHPVASALAEKLSALTGGALPRAFYTDNGSCAVEVALKLSLQHRQLTGDTRRTGIIAMTGAYHGDTFGTMAVGDGSTFHGRFRPWCFPVDRFPAPEHVEVAGRILRSDAAHSLAALETLLREKGATTSCLIMEPGVQGSAGMRLQPVGFVSSVAGLCRAHGVHLILDEVFTGFGRLGGWLIAHDEGVLSSPESSVAGRSAADLLRPPGTPDTGHGRSKTAALREDHGVTPDFLVLAKGLTGGYLPLAATLTREDIYQTFLGAVDEWRTFYHGHTFTGNPLACAVALKSIELLLPAIASGDLRRRAEFFGECVRKTFSGHPNVSEIRQRGFLAAIDLKPAPGQKPWTVNDRTGYRVCLEARRHGLLIRPLGDSILLVPAPMMGEAELEELCEGTLAAMEAAL